MMTNLTCSYFRWAVDVKSNRLTYQQLCQAISCVQPEEKERLMKFFFWDDFIASLTGRLLMRKFVAEAGQVAFNSITFSRDARGKPYLLEPAELALDFNVSHQGNYAVLAGVSYDQFQSPRLRVGADVMKVEYSGGKKLTEFFRIMDRNFSHNEWKFIKSRSTDSDKLKAFIRHWCLKESYVKNVGVGITVNLQNISFNIMTENLSEDKILNDTTLTVGGNRMHGWVFEEHQLDDLHFAAISFNKVPDNFISDKFKLLSFEELLENSMPLLPLDEDYCRNAYTKPNKSVD